MAEAAHRSLRAAWVLVAGVLLAFGPTLAGDFVWDDLPIVRDNEWLHSLGFAPRLLRDDFWTVPDAGVSFVSGYFRPVVKGAWLLTWVASGGAAWAFHGLNVLLHLAVVVLSIGWISRRIGPSPAAPVAAVLGAAAVAFHPSRAESVGWVCGATDLWLGLFVLLAARAWDRVEGSRGVVLAGVFAVLAFLSKESGLLVPVVLAVDLAVLGREGLVRRSWASLAAVAGALAATWFLRAEVVPIRSLSGQASSPGEVVARVLGTVGYYARALFLPVEPSALSGDTGLDPSGIPLVPEAWLWLGAGVVLVVAGMLAVAWAFGMRAQVADFAWFLVFLAPVLNVTPLGYSMLGSERFLYVPMLGVAALLARLAVFASARLFDGLRWPVIAVAALSVLWTSVSFAHALRFGHQRALWADARERHPDSTYAADLLARALWVDGELEAAQAHAAFAVTRAVDGPARLRSLALWHEVGVQRWADAPAELRKSTEFCRFARSTRTRTEGTFEGATYVWDPAWAKDVLASPGFRSACAIASATVGDLAEAERLLRDWLATEPGRLSVNVNLVRVLAEQGRFDEAARVRDAALARFSDEESRGILKSIELRSLP